ncbi:MAG TPA: shikimate kinase [Candidatus Avacidaminococcus intestinavium]|uniref:Shikimate kinase n=1 Tax=Candidatus Avacidaminococcus intestinavium TaxID=2840684 RepID=A0A9D1MP40_9FIRM|nr:shikimate kinase [Candidatus Avacidaminococcus intestinavium]
MKNIVLIGMPGSGKSTIGQAVAAELQLTFYDADSCLERWEACTIKDLFAINEATFRAAETRTIERLAQLNSSVIATGGGVVINAQNIKNLRRNGSIVFLDRPVEAIMRDIEVTTRPLLKDGREEVKRLYHERYALYQEYADYIVPNASTAQTAIQKIVQWVRGGRR